MKDNKKTSDTPCTNETGNTNNEIEHSDLNSREKELLEESKRTQLLLDSSPFAAHFWDENHNMVDCNQAAVNLFNLSSKEEYIEKYFDLTPEFQPDGQRSLDRLKELINEAYETGYNRSEWMRQSLSGEPIPVEVTYVRVEYKGKNLIASYCRDLREHKKIMNELEHIHALNELQLTKLNAIVNATKIGVWDVTIADDDPVDPNNTFSWSNEFRHMLGYKDENDFPNVADSYFDKLHPEDKEKAIEAIVNHANDKTGKTPYDIEYRMLKKNGEYAYYRSSGEAIRDKNGNALRIAGALMDITETKNILHDTEKQMIEAEAANKAKSVFLSTMSHEIRTPMNAILGITEINLQNEALDEKVRESFEKIYVSGDLLLGIINDILDLSKIEAGKMELTIGKYEIASLVSDTAQLNMMRVGSKPIEFELYVDENVPAFLTGDELRVKQILNNLLSNAFKYTASGTVTLSVKTEKSEKSDEVILSASVSDTGQGMSKEQVNKLFDEYARFNTEANRTTEGTGLGMSITQKLIQLMNGKISVESEPGKGSTFTVRIPQAKVGDEILGKEMVENLHLFRTQSRAQMKRVQITRDPMPYGSVLIVDDVETNIFVAKGLMHPYSLKMDSVDSGFGAIEKIKSGKVYDIVFMDHMMPKMDGVETTKKIREMGYDQPIVALTANAVAGQADIFRKNGFDDFISKPIDIRQLNAVLNKLIRDKQPPDVIAEAKKNANTKNAQAADTAPQPDITEFFIQDATKALSTLEEISEKNNYSNEDDMQTYIINVHGMKSALANIGKADLSAVALKLEAAGREGKIDMIIADTPAFIESLRAYVNELSQNSKKSTIAPEDEDKQYLQEKLLIIKSACEEYDDEPADEALTELRAKEWSQKTGELLSSISELLLHSAFEEVVEKIDSIIN